MPFYVQFIIFITICNLKLCQLLIKTINDFTTLKSIVIVKTSEVKFMVLLSTFSEEKSFIRTQ